MYEVVYIVVVDLCQYVCEQCVGGDVEWYVEEDVSVVLIELVGQFGWLVVMCWCYVELEQCVVGWQFYFWYVVWVLGVDDMVV